MNIVGEKIKAARVSKDMSQKALGKLIGVTRNAVSLWESPEGGGITLANLRAVCSVLDLSLDDFTENQYQMQLEHLQLLPLVGEVRAGAWLEIEDEQEVTQRLPVVADVRFAGQKQFALRVVGTSMDKVAGPGSYVIAVEWTNGGVTGLRDGDLVVVRRNRAMTYECTLKRARLKGKVWELWPESNDPRHQEPIVIPDGSREVEVKIIGKVIGKYEPL